jgi:hypothetical protein
VLGSALTWFWLFSQGILKSINVNKLTKVGCKFIFWVADWCGGSAAHTQNSRHRAAC